MRRPITRFSFFRLFLIVTTIVILTSYSRAIVPLAEPSLPQRLALADLVVVGKVTALEPDLVQASPLLKIPGVGKIPYQVAVISMQTSILGGGSPRQLRVGYVVLPSASKESQLKYRRLARVKLAEGQGGCFFLAKHPEESFHVAQAAYDFLDESKTKNYAKKLAEIKHDAELLRDPDAGLQSKSPADRLRTAAMLIFSQSRGILTALAEAEWKEDEAPLELSPFSLFMRLDLTPEDGWNPPPNVTGQIAAAKKWLAENSGKYRIPKYVPEN